MTRDVAIIGGGASGLSAAVFVARYGLDTVVLDGGTSAIRQCVHLENFLGFPGGVSPDAFVELGREQAELAGCEIRDAMALEIERTDRGFRIRTQDGTDVTAKRVVAASLYDDNYLSAFEDDLTDMERDGRTPVEGLYVTGWLGDDTEHQAIINAGDGARAGVSLIRDVRREDEGLWEELADHYYDWTVEPGRYGGPKWEESMGDLVAESAPESATAAELDGAKERLKREYLGLEMDEDERVEHVERGRRLLRTHLLEESR